MPDIYKITLSDGRTFNVTTEGGPPSESDVLASLGTNAESKPAAATTDTPAAAKAVPEPQRRSRTGQLYTPAAASGELSEMAHHFSQGVSPANVLSGAVRLAGTAVTDPIAAGQMLIEGVTQPLRTAASGNIPGAVGDALSMAVVGKVLSQLPAASRGVTLSKALTIAKMTKSPLASVVSALVPRVLEQLQKGLPEEAIATPRAAGAPPAPLSPQPGPARPPIQVVPPVEPAPVAAPPPEAPARVVTPIVKFNPSEAMTTVRQTFSALKETPQRGEVTNAMEFLRRGFSAEESVAKVIAKRPAPVKSAAERLAEKLKTPTDADVESTVRARNASGKWDDD